MAADLDQRSPDASQWGVGAGNVPGVSVGARDNARGSCISRGSVRGGGRCWPSRGRAVVDPRMDKWGRPNEHKSTNASMRADSRGEEEAEVRRASRSGTWDHVGGIEEGLGSHSQATFGSLGSRQGGDTMETESGVGEATGDANDVGASNEGVVDKAGSDEAAGQSFEAEEGYAGGSRAPSERLAFKLSVSLIDTYKLINQRYYAEKTRQQEQLQRGGSGKAPARQGGVYNHGLDDENFDYIVHEGEVFHGRYTVKETIGKGSFGKVYKAWDKKERVVVALKVIKSKRPFTMQAKVEVEILELLRNQDPEGKYNCARMLDCFMSHNHQCLVFEILSFNLYELLRSTQFQGVSLHLVRKFARHLLRALAFLSLPQVDVIHCDLKPENILLQHPKRSNIKVIDFGSSCRSNNKMYSYIQSRFYRSPEVMLGLPYTTAIDMWSLGCILVEMHTGEPLFAGVDQFDQMVKIISVLGMTPADVVERSPLSHRAQFFEVDDSDDDYESGSAKDDVDSDAEDSSSTAKERHHESRTSPKVSLNEPDSGRGGTSATSTTDDDSDHNMSEFSPRSNTAPPRRYRLRRHLLLKRARAADGASPRDKKKWTVPPRTPLSDIVGVFAGGPSGRREGEAGHDPATYGLFVNLVERMLDPRPETRITPTEALLHPFLVDPPPSEMSKPPTPTQRAEHDEDSWPTNVSFASASSSQAVHTTMEASTSESSAPAATTPRSRHIWHDDVIDEGDEANRVGMSKMSSIVYPTRSRSVSEGDAEVSRLGLNGGRGPSGPEGAIYGGDRSSCDQDDSSRDGSSHTTGSGGGQGGRGSGGSSSSGGARGGGTGATSGAKSRPGGVRRVRTRGGSVGGANNDASAKRLGHRRKEATKGVEGQSTPKRSDHQRHGGYRRGTDIGAGSGISGATFAGNGGVVLSVETRRGKALRRGQPPPPTSENQAASGATSRVVEGHAEAASGVAQLSLHPPANMSRCT